MNIIFLFIYILHILIWMFILLACLTKKLAYYNLYYIIPIIYIIHLLPFHILEKIKSDIYTNKNKKEDTELNIRKILILPHYFILLSNFLETRTTFNPFSPQGMMIFGLITSAYRLKIN